MTPRNILLAPLTACTLCACTAGGEALSVAPRVPNGIYYFQGFATVDVDYINRYACLDHRVTPLCYCGSRLSRTCECHC